MPKSSSSLATDIRRIVAPVLRECPSKCGIVTITQIKVSKDGSYVTVYVSALNDVELAMAFLEERRTQLQRALGSLKRYRIPTLRFHIDDISKRAQHIEDLLKRDNIQQGDS